MLIAYAIGARGPEVLPTLGPDGVERVPPEARWIDLYIPTAEEEALAQAFLGAEIPSREESQEIEFSSRFYAEDGAVFMTASVLAGIDLGSPVLTPFIFAVSGERIVTLRYDDMRAFRSFLARAKPSNGCEDASGVFLGLIEAFVDRTADVIEHVSGEVDRLNREVFVARRDARRRGRRLSALIGDIGTHGDLASKARESLASIERLVQFANTMLKGIYGKGAAGNRMKLALRDVRSLEDHVNFVLSKINFLLDATLGLISTEQNEVIGVLTVAATVVLPPTLIGTIYGMNFDDMPELHWTFGYPLALLAMAISALLPYLFFKRRGWL
ncbi:magnesium transporter CorA family protein [Prosthecomicrobium pneumaticum]|uniref:Magnesium transport protein CorA n=1 Tax=Prosthecomicrobium pneumaticum TaxID=81895 RepID=A0A7W9FLF1_9HYPH|nr:magnesium transporter CorA family protein [Prosthecomicrobium pneumaticum]MBB5752815.1 magnesium transporter [Prosthecomicrobium pneumaticum]